MFLNKSCVLTQIGFLFWHLEQFMYTTCSELGIFKYWTRNTMINLLSYDGSVNARISASEKDLTVLLLTKTSFQTKKSAYG